MIFSFKNLCQHGCGQPATYTTKSSLGTGPFKGAPVNQCARSHNSCPAVKAKKVASSIKKYGTEYPWQTPEVAKEKDIYKMKCAVKNGFSVLRLLQEDVCYNRIDWKNKLTNCIKYYESPVIIFIEESNMYFDHIDDELRPHLIEV